MTDLAGACALCGVHLQKDKDRCGEPDCPEKDEHGWEFLPPHRRAYHEAQDRINRGIRKRLDEIAAMPKVAPPIFSETDDA